MKKENDKTLPDKRIARDLTAVGKTILPFTKKIFGSKGFMEIDILTNWEQIVGEELAQYSFPQKIEFHRNCKNNGILHLAVPSGAFALEIEHRQTVILQKINAYFGYNAVSGLRILQNSTLVPKTEKTNRPQQQQKYLVTAEEENYIKDLSNEIENSQLKEILINLGKSVFGNNKEEKK